MLVISLLWLLLGGAFTTPFPFWQRTITSLQTALYSDTRRMMTARGNQSFASSAIMGVVFAAGWTPCIGPIYGAILTMAANGGDVAQAGMLLGAYSLGLGIPFLVAALVLDGAQVALRRIQRYMHQVELVTGAFLIAMGVLIATGTLQQLSTTFAGQFSDLSANIETCVTDFVNGKIPLNQLGPCLNAQALEQAAVPVATAPTAAPQVANAPTAAATAVGKLNTITGLAQANAADATSVTMGTEVGERALNFNTMTDDGQPVSLTALRGKVVFVNFWATWCGPCRQEMPTIDKVYQQDSDKVAVIAVNNRESPDLIAKFRQEIKVTFPVALDQNGDIQELYGVSEYPTTIVVDPTGVIRRRHLGELTDYDIQLLVSQLAA
jgi:cytochrome c-type biogenesis protein